MIHQLGSKNEWLVLSANFTTKFELVFVLTREIAFFKGFKVNRKSVGSSKNVFRDFQNSSPFEHGVIILNRSNNSVFLYLKIY